MFEMFTGKKVKIDNDQEMGQSGRNSHSKNRDHQCIANIKLIIFYFNRHVFQSAKTNNTPFMERGGLVVECRTPNQEVLSSIPTWVTVLCP